MVRLCGRGSLTQEEVVRGLIKTYRLGTDLEQVRAMRAMVSGIWEVFCAAGAAGVGPATRSAVVSPSAAVTFSASSDSRHALNSGTSSANLENMSKSGSSSSDCE